MVFSKDGLHEYNLEVKETKKGEKFSLFTSNGEQWTTKNEHLLSMTNHGNGIEFDRKFKDIDYSELLHIRILINFENKMDTNPMNREKYRIIDGEFKIKV